MEIGDGLFSQVRHSLRGLCGLKYIWNPIFHHFYCHSLRGLCGLKSPLLPFRVAMETMSQPARAVWIEIYMPLCVYTMFASQPARAVWIEIPTTQVGRSSAISHSLRGLCGLKYRNWHIFNAFSSHSLRGLCGLKSQTELIP